MGTPEEKQDTKGVDDDEGGDNDMMMDLAGGDDGNDNDYVDGGDHHSDNNKPVERPSPTNEQFTADLLSAASPAPAPSQSSSPATPRETVKAEAVEKNAKGKKRQPPQKKDKAPAQHSKGKHKGVVARLSVGRGGSSRRAKGMAPPTPGPERSEDGPQFVDISQVSGECVAFCLQVP